MTQRTPTSAPPRSHLVEPGSADLLAEVFDGLASGLIVVDAHRRLLAANRSAHELLGPNLPLTGEPACCALFGCRRGSGPLGDACVTELVADAAGPIPEIRLDLPAGSPAGAVWVTASPLSGDSSAVVFEIRRGARGDRRRRTEPHWLGDRRLTISALGETTVESAEGEMSGSWLGQRPGQLLKLLVTERGRALPGEEIAAALWPAGGANALNTVRHYVHVLRQRLEPDRARWSESSFVIADPSGYRLDALRVGIDVDLFEAHLKAASTSYYQGDETAAVKALEHAVDLYRGDFLADEPYSEWAFSERDRLRELAARAFRALTEYLLHTGHLDAAARHADRLLELEPFDAEVQRAVLTIAVARGRRSEAARRYGTMRHRLMREFGDELPFGLADLGREPPGALRLL